MKNLKSSVFYISLVLIITAVFSCTKMDHYYKDLVVERNYVGLPDSMWVYGGENRIQLNWLTPTDPSAKDLVVIWNNGRDSATTSINRNVDTGTFIIEGLPEGPFSFNVITKDANGTRSIGREVITEILGDQYKSRLSNRVMSYHVSHLDSVALFFIPNVDSTLLYSTIEYTDKNGDTKTAKLDGDENDLYIYGMDATLDNSIIVKSAVYPGNNIIDTFYTEESIRINDFPPLNTLTMDIPSDASIDYIDFNLVKLYSYAPDNVKNAPVDLQRTFDMGHLRGGGSKHNFVAVTSSRPSAFSQTTIDGINTFQTRNPGYFIDMGVSEVSAAFYDNLDENDRAGVIAAFDDAEADYTTADALWPVAQNQVVLFKSTDREIYVAIKAIVVDPDGPITIQFKVSRKF